MLQKNTVRFSGPKFGSLASFYTEFEQRCCSLVVACTKCEMRLSDIPSKNHRQVRLVDKYPHKGSENQAISNVATIKSTNFVKTI